LHGDILRRSPPGQRARARPYTDDSSEGPPLSTGIPGLDDILCGGLPADQLYLIEGSPGAGKTTLALQFLLEGVERGESVLYITLSESRRELLMVGRSHGWDLAKIHIREMEIPAEVLSPERQLTMFHPSELELSELIGTILRQVEEVQPARIVFDSLSEMRMLAQSALRYRRQVLALKQFFSGRQTTVLLLDDLTAPGEDQQLQSIAHGVIRLEQVETEYGAERRHLRVLKLRAVHFRGGLHDYLIRKGGLDVFPRLVAADHPAEFSDIEVSSGLAALDTLLGGGLPRGSNTLLVGPAGAGKSSVATQFTVAAAERGERSALFLFDETEGMLRARSRKLGLPLEAHIESGLVSVRQIEPAELSPGEFAAIIRQAVEGRDSGHGPAKLVLIDSLNGYLSSMSEEKQLISQLHELFKYTSQQGVLMLLTLAQSGLTGMAMRGPVDSTYLADTVILFRFFESFGRLRKAISVVKKRSGAHEDTLRELRMSAEGIQIGEPLAEFQGLLTGVPTFHGESPPSRREDHEL
jgi:circadian clock protein KaiC